MAPKNMLNDPKVLTRRHHFDILSAIKKSPCLCLFAPLKPAYLPRRLQIRNKQALLCFVMGKLKKLKRSKLYVNTAC
jgi:hypothetical protein